MAEQRARRGGKKNRKWDRFKIKCTIYSNERRQEKNQKRKLRKHLKHHPRDGQAQRALEAIRI